MAEIIKTAALAVSVCVLCAVIKQYRPEYAPIVQIAAVAVIVASAVRILQNIISQLDFFSGMSETGGECISVLIKTLGVAVAAQIAGDICRDNGNSAVGYRLPEFQSTPPVKAAIIALALPLIKSAVTLAKELINI